MESEAAHPPGKRCAMCEEGHPEPGVLQMRRDDYNHALVRKSHIIEMMDDMRDRLIEAERREQDAMEGMKREQARCKNKKCKKNSDDESKTRNCEEKSRVTLHHELLHPKWKSQSLCSAAQPAKTCGTLQDKQC